MQACFSSFPHVFPTPPFPHPPTPEPPAALPATPQDLQGSANESSTTAFLPRDKNLQVWWSPSLCLSYCLTPITCSAPNDSTSLGYRIGKVHNTRVFMVTTHGHDNSACLVNSCMQKKTHPPCLLLIPTGLNYKSCICRHLIPIQSRSKDACGQNWLVSHFTVGSIRMRLGWICRATCFRLNEISSA